jgi:hypothetical protein
LGALFPPDGRYALLVALTPAPDLFICAKELFLDAKLPRLGQCAAVERPAVRPSVTRGRAFCGLLVASGQRRQARGELTSQMGGGGRISLDVPSRSAKRPQYCQQLRGCHQQHLPHRACGPLGTGHRWISGFAPPHPRNAEGSCHSRGSTTAGSFRTEQVLLREMGNASTKS